MASVYAWLLRAARDSLIAFGRIWVWIPPVESEEPLQGPPPGHPERLCPDVPLNAVEKEILRHFRDIDPPAPSRDP
ncbi:DUF6059 family protein [Streptomyces olindensis]|uniref:DUF6059 family protein n=1 Tax=Streptomyces olindensis TaxID=358823 RepID=A0ABV2XSK6_9ACTN|nr:hypothetical protein DF19_21835 [Streptomyces olindensis]